MEETYRIDGIFYLSLKAAAEKTGYTADYIGQLGRQERVHTRKIGRKVYVDIVDLARYSGKQLIDGTKPRGNEPSVALFPVEMSVLSDEALDEVLEFRKKALLSKNDDILNRKRLSERLGKVIDWCKDLKSQLLLSKSRRNSTQSTSSLLLKNEFSTRFPRFSAFVFSFLFVGFVLVLLMTILEGRVTYMSNGEGEFVERLDQRIIVNVDPLADMLADTLRLFSP